MTDYTTTYTDAMGHEYEAIQVPWADVTELLFREHDGSPEDDRELQEVLVFAKGGPAWILGAEGWTDEHGWGLYHRPTVQMIDAHAYEDQGLVQPGETSENLEEWLASVADDYTATYCGHATGWGEYSAIVKLQQQYRPDMPALYYLVTAEALRGLDIPDPYDLVAIGDIAQMAGVLPSTASQWWQRRLLPEPVATTSDGRVWLRRDIESWLRATGRAKG